MARVVVAPAALEDLDRIIATLHLPQSTRARIRASLEPLAGFPLLGVGLTGRWSGFRFLLGPWSWMLLVYVFDEEIDRVIVATARDARSGRAAPSDRRAVSANLIRVRATAPEPEPIARAAAILRRGGLVAFPTETVYGLGAHALDPAAVQRIFEAKGRPSYNPLIVHVPDVVAARRLVAEWPDLAERAAAAFWPGPLTLVLTKRPDVPAAVTAGLGTVAVRVPAHPVALALLAAAGVPVAAPSANRFTRVSPTTAAHVVRGLGDRADLILDGGATPFGIESTVLDLTTAPPSLLRPGVVGLDELEAVLGPVNDLSGAVAPDPAAPRASPGMTARHYSPHAELRVLTDAAATAAAARARSEGRKVGAVVRGGLSLDVDEVVALPDDARGYARLFYAALHTLDEAGCDLILVEPVPETAAWAGVRDRLRRAGAGSGPGADAGTGADPDPGPGADREAGA